MKRFLLSISLLTLVAAGFVGCSQTREWNREQRKAMRESLRDYRRMVYLNDLNDAEFVAFTDDVAEQLEESYPVYTTFIAMPGVNDTVDVVVVTTIVDELNAEQQHAFYKCFAGKVNATYATTAQFFNAVLADTTDMSQIRRLGNQCANDLFDWTVTEVDIIEMD